MGKPFQGELAQLTNTYNWGLQQNIQDLRDTLLCNINAPFIIIGSGGSLSACHYAAQLFQRFGVLSKAMTPLEVLTTKEIIPGSNVLIISASGKNNDILLAFQTIVEMEPKSITSIVMKTASPLKKLSDSYSVKAFEFNLPSGKDGFLATNSLVGYFILLYRTLKHEQELLPPPLPISTTFLESVFAFVNAAGKDKTYSILYARWSQPIAADLESKFAEAGIGNILISDYRNFGHGRHNWFDKRGNSSVIIALITPEDEKLAIKTLSFLPKEIPILIISSEYQGPTSSIDLLAKSFHLVNNLGKIQKIDPGRPGVPAYGSKLYNLKYANLLKNTADKSTVYIQRKLKRYTHLCYEELTPDKKQYWQSKLKKFTSNFKNVEFGSIIFDYDGTLCSAEERIQGPSIAVADSLKIILENGITIGIATGRGKSVREALQKHIPKKLWPQVFIGYYNGGDIGLLSDDSVPDLEREGNKELSQLNSILSAKDYLSLFSITLRPQQLTIEASNKLDWGRIKALITHIIKCEKLSSVELLESSHSIDIISKEIVSKINLVSYCSENAIKKGFANECLCIGDKGQWPGNDYEILSTPFSLSVDEVSGVPDNCWNIASPGIRNVAATLEYLSWIRFEKDSFKFQIR